jgi:hypothetical protein
MTCVSILPHDADWVSLSAKGNGQMLSFVIPLLALQASSAASDPVDRLLADHDAATRASIPCRATDRKDEIVVCALRDADRWRVAYIVPDAGARSPDDVPAETARLLNQGNNCRNMALSVAGCGMVGASATVGNGRGLYVERARPLAP